MDEVLSEKTIGSPQMFPLNIFLIGSELLVFDQISSCHIHHQPAAMLLIEREGRKQG
jgi:hypothetical protein